jgi:hypothetical protein
MRKALAWAAAGTTITAGMLSLAATANAAPVSHPSKTPTALSVKASPAKGHTKASIAGTLTWGRGKPIAKEVVALDIVNGKKLIPAGVAHTARNGTVSFSVAPKKTTAYELVFSGTKALGGSHSGIVLVRVK